MGVLPEAVKVVVRRFLQSKLKMLAVKSRVLVE